MKIKLVRFPYKDFEIGEVVDLGEEKNRSMVSIQRAVWFEDPKTTDEPKNKKVVKEVVTQVEAIPKKKKKLLTNKLSEKVQAKKDESLVDEPKNTEEKSKGSKKKSFWDKII